MHDFDMQDQPAAAPQPPSPPPPAATPSPRRPRASAPRKPRRGCMSVAIIFAVIILVACLVIGAAAMLVLGMSGGSLSGQRDYTVSEKILHSAPDTADKIAIIDIQGVIMGTDTNKGTSSGIIKTVLNQVKRDEDVVAIVLNLDTPGGEVIASDEIYNAVACVDIPVVACMRSVCASGGYYIAAAADYIVANEVTLTGSIGVIIPRYRYHGLLDKVGVETNPIRSGPMKDMLSGGRDRSVQEDAAIDEYIQSLVDETFRRFCTVVAEGRDDFLTWEDVKDSPFGDGRIMLGRQARELGLVDECGYFEHAVEAAMRLAAVDDASVVRFKRTFTFAEILFSQAQAKVQIETGLEGALPKLEPTRMYYLMPNLGD